MRCPARRILVNARKWRNKASQVSLPTLLPVTKVRSNARWRGRSLAFKTRWRMCFSGFRTKSFTIICFHVRACACVCVCVCVVHWHCSAQLSMFNMEKRYRNKIIIIIILLFMQTFSLFLLLTDKTRTAVKVIYLLISMQFIIFHALWMAIFLSFFSSQQQQTMFECSVNLRESKNKKQKKYWDEF